MRLLIFVLTALISFTSVVAEESATKGEVSILIEQLSSPNRKTRLEAEQSLLNMGEEVLVHFNKIDEMPVATSEALQRIKRDIQTRAIDEKLKGSTVSFSEGQSLSEISDAVRTQTGNIVLFDPTSLGNHIFPLEAKQVPFWELINLISEKEKIGWVWDAQHRLVLSANEVRLPGQHTVTDCARLNIDVTPRRQSFKQTNLRRTQRLNCRLDVEPRLHLFYATVEDGTFSLANNENALKPFTPNSKRELTSSNNQSVEFPLDFIMDRDSPLGALTLTGKMTLMTAAQRVPCRFPLKQSPSETISVGESEVLLETVQNSESNRVVCTLQVKLKVPPETFTSHRLGMLHQSIWLETSTGRKLPTDMRIISMADSTHTVRVTFETSKEPNDTLVYEVPHLIQERTLMFRVKNISLAP